MSHYYRCSKCRAFHTFPRVVDSYERRKKCRLCGHLNFYLDKQKTFRKDYCKCEGYHFTHRIKSPYCIHNPEQELRVRVERYNEELAEVLLDIAFNAPLPDFTPETPPF